MAYKIIPPNHVVEVTISLEQGVLLSANLLCRFIIECCMARAQHLYPVTICHYIVEGTHIHFVMVVQDPSDITGFVRRLKTELAHYLNSLLGRKKRTVWCKGFFCAPILTKSSVMKKIRYLYTNPAKDDLEVSIENYPGLSSWNSYKTGRHQKQCPRLHRPMIPFLPGKMYPQYTYKRIRKMLKDQSRSSHTLDLKPDAWMDVFKITDESERKATNEAIGRMIEEKERHFAALRQKEGRKVLGREALIARHLDPDYMPERSGKKMWCICDDKELRMSYIAWAKEIKQEARRVYERWKRGDFSVAFPPGVFPPARPKLANMTELAVCY